MAKFLIKRFVPDGADPQAPEVRAAVGRLSGFELAQTLVEKMLHPTAVVFSTVTAAVLMASIW